MNSARNRILDRLRTACAEASALERQYAVHDWPKEELVRRFTDRMRSVRAVVERTSLSTWTNRLQELARERSLENLLFAPDTAWGRQLRGDADNTGLPRAVVFDQPIEAWKQSLFFEVQAALTSCVGGIAETGTLVLWPTSQEPRSMSLVPPIHFVLLETKRLYSTFAQMMREENWQVGMPTNALLISGPSKSADIEQTLAYGVHGPKELIVLLIDD